MPRRAQRLPAEDRRREILSAALTSFGRGGFHETTIDDIAREAGLSKGAVYWHFAGKRELFYALVDQILGDFEGELATPDPTLSGRERLERMVDAALRVDLGAPGMAELQAEFMSCAAREPEMRERLLAAAQGSIQLVVDAISHGVKSGEFRPVDPETVAYGMLATLDGLQVHQLLRPDLEVNRIWRESIELIVRGLEVRS